jgi:hypothetical protein
VASTCSNPHALCSLGLIPKCNDTSLTNVSSPATGLDHLHQTRPHRPAQVGNLRGVDDLDGCGVGPLLQVQHVRFRELGALGDRVGLRLAPAQQLHHPPGLLWQQGGAQESLHAVAPHRPLRHCKLLGGALRSTGPSQGGTGRKYKKSKRFLSGVELSALSVVPNKARMQRHPTARFRSCKFLEKRMGYLGRPARRMTLEFVQPYHLPRPLAGREVLNKVLQQQRCSTPSACCGTHSRIRHCKLGGSALWTKEVVVCEGRGKNLEVVQW